MVTESDKCFEEKESEVKELKMVKGMAAVGLLFFWVDQGRSFWYFFIKNLNEGKEQIRSISEERTLWQNKQP